MMAAKSRAARGAALLTLFVLPGCLELSTQGEPTPPEVTVQPPEVLWSLGLGDPQGSGSQYLQAVAVDPPTETLVTAAYFDAALTVPGFEAMPFASYGSWDVALIKHSASTGLPLWVRQFGDAGEQVVHGVAIDLTGDVIVAGGFDGALMIDPVPPLYTLGNVDAYVIKLDASGNALFAYGLGSPDFQVASDVAVDTEGNIVFVGTVMGSIEFGGKNIPMISAADIFVAKLSATGSPLWMQRAGAAAFADTVSRTAHVATTPTGEIVIAGTSRDVLVFPGCTIPSYGGQQAFVVKLDAMGNCLWGQSFGNVSGEARVGGVAVGPLGQVVVTGGFTGDMSFGATVLENPSGDDAFVVQIDQGGQVAWSRHFSGPGNSDGTGLAFDAQGNVRVTGNFRGVVDFEGKESMGSPEIGNAPPDIFVAELSSKGDLRWGQAFINEGYASARGLAMGTKGETFVVGVFENQLDLGGFDVTSTGVRDAFVFALSP